MAITVQSSYSTTFTAGFPGMLADGATQNRITRNVEDAAGIAFGKACFKGTGDRGITATPGTKFQGITIADAGVIPPVGGTADVYPQYASASLLDQGDIWVTAGANTTDDAPVYVTSAGVFTPTSTSNTLIPGATFMDTVSSGSPVRIRLAQQ